jgi:hypothetical protein
VGTIAILLRGVDWSAIVGLTSCGCAVGACGVVLGDDALGRALLTAAFALLAAASAFTLDEAASVVVDVTPTKPAPQIATRAVALAVPLCGGLTLVVATALHTTTVPAWGMSLALVGNLLLGFAIAGVARLRTGEPGVGASSAALFVLVVPVIYGPVARRVHTFPGSLRTSGGVSANTLWWLLGALSLAVVVLAARCDRVIRPIRLPGRRLRLRTPGRRPRRPRPSTSRELSDVALLPRPPGARHAHHRSRRRRASRRAVRLRVARGGRRKREHHTVHR